MDVVNNIIGIKVRFSFVIKGVKCENLMGQDFDPSRQWKYRCLCSVPFWK